MGNWKGRRPEAYKRLVGLHLLKNVCANAQEDGMLQQ